MEPIAIVGQSFRLPGDVETDSSLWEMLENGRNVMSEWPKTRSTIDSFYQSSPQRDNTLTSRGAHFLSRDPAIFDAPFFSITSKEAAAMDPQQRWLLETSYRALENAGIPAEQVAGTPTAVFAASMTDDYLKMVTLDQDTMPAYLSPGTNPSILANRLSWYFDLRGPSMSVNTACSSSLMAIDLACQSLRAGTSSMALVGASNALLSLETTLNLSSMSFLSPDSVSRSFDARANGYARGEGVVVFVLKKVSDAVRDGDSIRAIIRATGTNQDGHTPGITQPNPAMQQQLMRDLYRRSGLDIKTTRYFEAHGTGTQLGDSSEVNAIGRVFRSSRSSKEPLYVGSIKANIGHLEGTSTLASILKSVLILERGLIPPNALFEKLNPKINAKFYNVEVPSRCIQWPCAGLRRISINSFGFGGSNGHAILDDAYHTLERLALAGLHNTVHAELPSDLDVHSESSSIPGASSPDSISTDGTSLDGVADEILPKPISIDTIEHGSGNEQIALLDGINGSANHITHSAIALHNSAQISNKTPRLLVLSAKDEAAIKRMVDQHSAYYSSKISGSQEKLDTYARIISTRRSIMSWRSFAIANSETPDSMSFSTPVRSSRETGIAFVFTGQGAQYVNMAMELLQFPKFQDVIQQCDKVFQESGATWNIPDVLQNADRINQPEISQPTCTAIQLGMFELMKAWDVKPATVIGHSSGEIAAAYAIGALDLTSACRIAYHRGRLSSQLATTTSGAMISVNLSESAVSGYLAKLSLENAICIACINSPSNCTLSGEKSDIETLKSHLDQDAIFARVLRTGAAYHSPAMQKIAQPYLDSLNDLARGSTDESTIMISSVTGAPVSVSTVSQAQYWVDNLVSPVRFLDAIEYVLAIMPKEQQRLNIFDFIEIGPHGALRTPIKDIMKHLGKSPRYSMALSRFETPMNSIVSLAGALFSNGYSVNVGAVNLQDDESPIQHTQALVDIPSYPFDETLHYWHESRLSRDWRCRGACPDILGVRSADWNPLSPRWRKILSVDSIPWMADHVVNGSIVFPGAGTMVMALEAVRQMANNEQKIANFFIEEATNMNPIIVDSEAKSLNDCTEVITQLRPLRQVNERGNRFDVQIFTYHGSTWRECFNATVAVAYEPSKIDDIDAGFEAKHRSQQYLQRWEDANEQCNVPVAKSTFYKALRDIELCYGDTFQLLEDLHWDGKDLGRSQINVNLPEHATDGFVHPAILDSICQTVFASISKGASISIPSFVPHKIKDAWIASDGWKYPHNTHINTLADTRWKVGIVGLDSELTALAADGTTLAHIGKFELLPVIDNQAEVNRRKNLLHGIEWKPQLSLLSQEQVQECCSLPSQSDDKVAPTLTQNKYLEKLDAVLRGYLQLLLPKVSDQDWSKVPPHHKQFFDWLQDQMRDNPSPLADANIESLETEAKILQDSKPGWTVFTEVAKNMDRLLQGELDPLDLLFTTDLAGRLYDDLFGQVRNQQLETYFSLISHEKPTLRILEVGAGTGGMSDLVLSILRDLEERTGGIAFSQYVYTDISASFFEKAQERFAHFGDRMQFKTYNIETDSASQGFEPSSFDVVIAGSVLHATTSLGRTLSNLHQVLVPGGRMMLHETTRPDRLFMGLGFGPLKGWWLSEESFRNAGPTITEAKWDEVLRDNGFTGNDLVVRDYEDDAAHTFSVIATTSSQPSSTAAVPLGSRVLCILNDESEHQRNVSKSLEETIKADLTDCSVEFQSLTLAELVNSGAKANPTDYVIILAELDASILSAISAANFATLQSSIQVWKHVLWAAGVSNSGAPYESLKDGLLRSLRTESHGKRIVSLTLEEGAPATLATQIAKVFDSAFIQKSPEIEFKVKNGQIAIPRLVSETTLNTTLDKSLHLHTTTSPWLEGPPLRLEIAQRGSLDSLCYTEDQVYYEPLAPMDVEMEAKTWAISFRDIYVALGKLEEADLGTDYAGVVSRVGKDVTKVKIGDRICMIALGCMKTYPRSSRWTVRIPDSLSFEEAAAVANPGLTAYYSLIDIARLQSDESILIHAAAGATGQLSILVAQMIGAEVFCTVSTTEKKELLMREFGIPEDHIFYSRNTSFKAGILRMTGGKGVDVVLNSLTGDGLRASWQCTAPFGRFVELGKADIKGNSQLPMGHFAKNVSYMAVDLVHVLSERPAIGERILVELMRLIEIGKLRSPSPLHSYRVDQVEEAFRYFQSGKNTGRTIISIDSKQPVPKLIRQRPQWSFDSNSTYLVAGGLGGIGRGLLTWMASHGARNLVAVSRSAGNVNATPAVAKTISDLSKEGVNVVTFSCDVSNSVALQEVLQKCSATLPPIRGCINAAMVLQDSIFENMTHFQWQKTIDSKVATTWNLHSLLPSDLDFFICLSSAAGVAGSMSQANYAAGCTFQDSLARSRVAQGQKSLSIDLGIVRTIGTIAEGETLARNLEAAQAMLSVEADELFGFLDVFCDPKRPCETDPDKGQVSLGLATPSDLITGGHEALDMFERPLFGFFSQPREASVHSTTSQSIDFKKLFSAAESHADRVSVVVDALARKLARALSMQPEDIDSSKPLHVFGIDSLVAVELKNWILKEFQAEVAVFDIMGSPSAASLCELITKISSLKTAS